MAEYIKREDAKKAILEACGCDYRCMVGCNGMCDIHAGSVWGAVDNIPAADVVDVVRCKDCKHLPFVMSDSYMLSGKIIPPDKDELNGDYVCPFLCYDSYYSKIPPADFFCAYGERKTDETEA